MTSALRVLVGCTLLATSLAGCGVRGSLDLPPEAKAQQQKTANAESGQGKPAGAAPKPHKPFILDGLLR
ncbi:MAG: lipoprotein [Alphaproteobacteria bacterium]|nr:lipoprotein [Alphaproteobacteria bacterium]